MFKWALSKVVAKGLAVVTSVAVVGVLFSGCGEKKEDTGEGKLKVGVAMPTDTGTLQRWQHDGMNVKKALEDAGYFVDLKYAGESESSAQLLQIEQFVEQSYDILVIAPVASGVDLDSTLAKAKAKNIPVIAYDRLIMDAEDVTYHVTFDNWTVGVMQANFIVKSLGLDKNDSTYNIEFFTGDVGDNNTTFYYEAAMSVLKPYLESGKLNCVSGQTSKQEVSTPGWLTSNAKSRMTNLVNLCGYGPEEVKLDAVLCSNDSTATGVVSALLDAGYTKENIPVITGQDGDIDAIEDIIAETLSMTIFKDTRVLAQKTVEMVTSILGGTAIELKDGEVLDEKTYDNNKKIVPTYLMPMVEITLENYKEALFDIGYYEFGADGKVKYAS